MLPRLPRIAAAWFLVPLSFSPGARLALGHSPGENAPGRCASASASTPAVGPGAGALVIHGGGPLGREIVERFVSLAGGTEAPFIVIPTASESATVDVKKVEESWAKRFGVTHVTVLHSRDRAVADT